ncbi:Protein CBG27733 [Caenorhabditis briggsae]|nr:Protein CBG27733 [Caenorhabditis briggsae]CAS00011.1 Protein CBG27733 [Caenorhabditis briggsae]
MSHRVEINLNTASDRTEQARADVVEAHKLQKRAQALKVIILVGTILILLFLLYALLEYDMCQFLSFC